MTNLLRTEEIVLSFPTESIKFITERGVKAGIEGYFISPCDEGMSEPFFWAKEQFEKWYIVSKEKQIKKEQNSQLVERKQLWRLKRNAQESKWKVAATEENQLEELELLSDVDLIEMYQSFGELSFESVFYKRRYYDKLVQEIVMRFSRYLGTENEGVE